ncbi:hypothetical protein [Mastigocoleus sp. MO_188.B34]
MNLSSTNLGSANLSSTNFKNNHYRGCDICIRVVTKGI